MPNTRQKVIIFDIDNTLAYIDKSNGNFRRNYDWSKVNEDKPIPFMCYLLSRLYTLDNKKRYIGKIKIIYSTGRDESARNKTLEWIDENIGFPVDSKDLYMKPLGSYEQSTITKHRVYTELSKNYDVELVIDDDPKVISMFTAMGVNCLQPLFVNL